MRVITMMFCRSALAHFVLVWLGNPQAIVIIWNSALFGEQNTFPTAFWYFHWKTFTVSETEIITVQPFAMSEIYSFIQSEVKTNFVRFVALSDR